MKEEHCNILVGTLFVLFIIYLVYNVIYFKEGLENAPSASANTISSSSSLSGIAGNATTYAANIKQKTINLNDTLLISKYKKDYESIIVNLDDLLNSVMLQTVCNIDTSAVNVPAKLVESMKILNELSVSKEALNKVMKFVDSYS